jgi:predicted RNA-binding protein with PUA-like domain
MAYWLVKSEPSAWSWDQQVAKGAKGEAWTGVRNFTARQNLVKMKKGDRAFFYHSNEGKEIVGIAEIIKEAYPDPTDKTGKFVCVDIKADKPLKTPVTMAAIKAEKKLAAMALVKYSRLSVQPVTAEEWKMFARWAGYSAYAAAAVTTCARSASRFDCERYPFIVAAKRSRMPSSKAVTMVSWT